MGTENAMNLDQAVEAFLAPVESAESGGEAELDAAADSLLENEENTEEVDSDVENSEEDESDDSYEEESDEDDDEYDTDDESAEADDEPDQVEPETITVKVDGEEVSVTLDDLKRSYSGQGKIQKGMQEAAEARKQAQAMQEQAAAMAQQLTAMYQQVQEKGFVAPPKEPSRELFDSDPIGYMEAKMNYDDQVRQYQAQQQQLTQMQQIQMQQQQQAMQQQIQREMEILREKVPEFSSPDQAVKLRENLMKYGSEYGYSEQELQGITDHRALLILRDAMRYRQSQAKRSQVEKKAKGARPVIKPQAKRTSDPKRQKVKQGKSNLKKTGSINDALSLIMNT